MGIFRLLLAHLKNSYEKVKASEVVEASKVRAKTIIEEEATMSAKDRANPEYFPEFLQVLRATEVDTVWSGLSGKIEKEIAKVTNCAERLEQDVSEMKQLIRELKAPTSFIEKP
eukprot:COSAG06_NODE_65_length_26676_cov_11.671107_23_plen_114_part_00